MQQSTHESVEAIREIRDIMNKSSRFLSLSGMSGIWAGVTALGGAAIAYSWLQKPEFSYFGKPTNGTPDFFDSFTIRLMMLGILVFGVALAGALFFTVRKAKRNGHNLWTNASKQLITQLFFPLFAGGVFSVSFIYNGCGMFVSPACLVFYGLALISGSRHTLSDIKYLGMLEVSLGLCGLFLPGYGLVFWTIGFGLLHILYGAMMWNKYDK